MSSNDGSGSSGSSSSGGSLSRLAQLGRQLLPIAPVSTKSSGSGDDEQQEQLGSLSFGPSVQLPVFKPKDLSRLPQDRLLLSLDDPVTLESLEWMAKKYVLNQDML